MRPMRKLRLRERCGGDLIPKPVALRQMTAPSPPYHRDTGKPRKSVTDRFKTAGLFGDRSGTHSLGPPTH